MSSCVSSVSLFARSIELNHVEVVEWHEVSVASEDVHETSGVLDRTVAVASCWLSAVDETEFTLMCLLCAVMPVGAHARCLSLAHDLVVSVKALVGVLDDE